MRQFKALVKPYLYLDVADRNLVFGETISLEEQQANHKSVLDAVQFGWLTEMNKKKKTPHGPSNVETVLEKQAELIKGMLSTYEAMKVKDPQSELQAMLRDQTAVLMEIRSFLAQPKPESKPDVDVLQVLNEIKENLKNRPVSFAYNSEKPTEKDGFKIQDVEDTYIAKVGDLDVKNSKIVTETHSVSGTDDALAALKALKKK